MRTLKLIVEYDGSVYGGWQIQPNVDTVQSRLESAIEQVTGRVSCVTGSGRTDAGVHALGQCAHFKTKSRIEADKLLRALNVYLPDDISVRSLVDVPTEFHARFSATGKTYRYRVVTGPSRPAIDRDFVFFCPFKLSLPKMKAGAKILTGSHNFEAFCAKSAKNPKESYVREVTGFNVKRSGREIVFTVSGKGFLYKMVRNMVGTLLELGRGRFSGPEELEKILRSRDRQRAGATVPAHGLCLLEVEYPEEFCPEKKTSSK